MVYQIFFFDLADILRLIEDYNKAVVSRSFRQPSIGLFEFITTKVEGYPDSEDDQFPNYDGAGFDEDSNKGGAWDSSARGRSPDYKASTP